jgi:hypothetical protein
MLDHVPISYLLAVVIPTPRPGVDFVPVYVPRRNLAIASATIIPASGTLPSRSIPTVGPWFWHLDQTQGGQVKFTEETIHTVASAVSTRC